MSNIFTLNWADLGKGVVMAFLGAFLTSVYAVFEAGSLPTGTDLKTALTAALITGGSYLLKQLLTNNEGSLLKPNTK
jgi:hypothetical protein